MKQEIWLKNYGNVGTAKCGACGVTIISMATCEFDHVCAVAKGGETTVENMQAICRGCNSQKGTTNYRLPELTPKKINGFHEIITPEKKDPRYVFIFRDAEAVPFRQLVNSFKEFQQFFACRVETEAGFQLYDQYLCELDFIENSEGNALHDGFDQSINMFLNSDVWRLTSGCYENVKISALRIQWRADKINYSKSLKKIIIPVFQLKLEETTQNLKNVIQTWWGRKGNVPQLRNNDYDEWFWEIEHYDQRELTNFERQIKHAILKVKRNL